MNLFKQCKDYFFPSEEPVKDVVIDIPNEDTFKLSSKKGDWKEISSTIFYSVLDGIKIIMATLLSIFVPQYCENTGTTCSLSDNFTDLTSFNVFVLFFNFLTLASYIKLIFVQNSREAYFISHLEESKDHPINSLEQNVKSYPRILYRVKKHNKKLLLYTRLVLYLMILNILFSCSLIYIYFYDGFRSITVMLSNILLISSKLYSLYTISNDCNGQKTLAYSTIHQSTVSYNIPDKKYDKYMLFYKPTHITYKTKNDILRYRTRRTLSQ